MLVCNTSVVSQRYVTVHVGNRNTTLGSEGRYSYFVHAHGHLRCHSKRKKRKTRKALFVVTLDPSRFIKISP